MDTEACGTSQTHYRCGRWIRSPSPHKVSVKPKTLKNINIGLRSQGYDTPLVADVHFNPKVADVAAQYAEKVRINPGNYVDPGRNFPKLEYTDEEYAQEIEKIRARFIPFLNICKENHTAIRIGVNHGSLSDRIMSHYGDTLKVWWNRAWNFLHLCCGTFQRCGYFHQGIQYRCNGQDGPSAGKMEKEGMAFPASFGSYRSRGLRRGRKNKILIRNRRTLADGLGDTIRVSLSEAPWKWNSGSPQTGWLYTNSGRTSFYSWKKLLQFNYLSPGAGRLKLSETLEEIIFP